MSSETCTRVRDAAASGDGRMWQDADLLQHAEHCDACREDLRARRASREFKDAFPVLASIAAEADRPRSSSKEARALAARRRRVVLMLLAVLSIVGFVIRRNLFPGGSRASMSATDVPVFHISNLENALFESKAEGAAVRSSMTRGVAVFHVEPLGHGQSFVLALPDGDLEVRGTRFVVRIDRGKTQSVEVNEGAVVLRLQGHPEMLLKAGQRWPDPRVGRPMVSFLPVEPPSPPTSRSREAPKPSD